MRQRGWCDSRGGVGYSSTGDWLVGWVGKWWNRRTYHAVGYCGGAVGCWYWRCFGGSEVGCLRNVVGCLWLTGLTQWEVAGTVVCHRQRGTCGEVSVLATRHGVLWWCVGAVQRAGMVLGLLALVCRGVCVQGRLSVGHC